MSKEALIVRDIIEEFVSLDIAKYIMTFIYNKNIFHKVIYCSCDECKDPWDISEGYKSKNLEGLIYCTECFEFKGYNINDFTYFKNNYVNTFIDTKDIDIEIHGDCMQSINCQHFCTINIMNHLENKIETHKCIMTGKILFWINDILGRCNLHFNVIRDIPDIQQIKNYQLLKNVTLLINY